MEVLVFQPWYWLVLGLVLIALESLGTGGFLLGGALAGILLSIITWLKGDFLWTTQVIIFCVLAVVFTLLYWRVFKRFNLKSDSPKLNDRAAQLHGRVITLTEDLPHGIGRTQIGDTLWKVKGNEAMPKGTLVTINGNQGMTLLIEQTEENNEENL